MRVFMQFPLNEIGSPLLFSKLRPLAQFLIFYSIYSVSFLDANNSDNNTPFSGSL